MAEGGEVRLPSEFLYSDFAAGDAVTGPPGSWFLPKSPQGVESCGDVEDGEGDEDYLAGLTREMTYFFLHEDDHGGVPKDRDMASSPQSTLSGGGFLSPGSGPAKPEHTAAKKSQSPELRFSAAWELGEENRDDPWDFNVNDKEPAPVLVAAAAAAADMKSEKEQTIPSSVMSPAITAGYYGSTSALIQHQLQAAQHRFHAARPAAIRPPNFSAAAALQNMQKRQVAPQQLVGTGMGAAFISPAKKESAGTGVFLPRRPGVPIYEAKKKPSSTPVLLPARVVQALNLNLDELGATARYPGGFVLDYDALVSRSNSVTKRRNMRNPEHHRRQPQRAASSEARLPQDWTY